MTQVAKKNHLFKKKEETTHKTISGLDPEKHYEFELIKTYERYKGTDEDGRPAGLPYPEMWNLPNTGIAYDEVTKQKRRFRFLNGVNTIWQDEQDFEYTPQEVAAPENEIVFVKGKLSVAGMDQSKLAVLLNSDYFEGKKVRIKNVVPEFRLINPDTVISESMDAMDKAFEAESAAREATDEQMLAYAVSRSMITSDINKLRRDFILAAKTNPADFMKHFVNPRNEYVYKFAKALEKNEISHASNLLIWTGNQEKITEVNSGGDVANELADRAMKGDKEVTTLFEQLERLD